MSKKSLLWLTVLGIVLCSSPVLTAQEAASTTPDETSKPFAAYRLDFAISEFEDGKKVNTRHYSMNVVPGFTPTNEIKIGSRIPVEAKPGELQYIDIGTNIWSRMTPQGNVLAQGAALQGPLQLEVRADLSNLAVPEQEGRASVPVVRQLKISASTLATLDKPNVIGVVDDPNSKRQFQLEVTVTKLK